MPSSAFATITSWSPSSSACSALWTVVALNGVYAAVVTYDYRLGLSLLALFP